MSIFVILLSYYYFFFSFVSFFSSSFSSLSSSSFILNHWLAFHFNPKAFKSGIHQKARV